MMDDKVRFPGMFGFLTTRLSPSPENVATEGLAYVLRTSMPVSRAFEDYLRRIVDLPTGLHYVTQSAGEDGAIPDLVGLASDGSNPLLVEAKFWAGLTNHQPVSYLRRLPAKQPAMLLFVVPSVRIEVLWTEVLTRLTAAGLTITAEQADGEYRSVLLNAQQALAMTSWRALLAVLVDAAVAAGDRSARSDLDQLNGLCERMDSEGFVPLTGEDLSGSVAVRLLQYTDLINRVVDRMVSTGTASTKGLTSSAGTGWWGRYIAIADVVCLLRFNAAAWAHDRATPIWLQIGYRGKPSVSAILDSVAPLRAQRNRVFPRRDSVEVAIDLPTNVEVDAVVESVIQQIDVVVSYLTMPGSAAGGGDRLQRVRDWHHGSTQSEGSSRPDRDDPS